MEPTEPQRLVTRTVGANTAQQFDVALAKALDELVDRTDGLVETIVDVKFSTVVVPGAPGKPGKVAYAALILANARWR